jgi:hypothetical protein
VPHERFSRRRLGAIQLRHRRQDGDSRRETIAESQKVPAQKTATVDRYPRTWPNKRHTNCQKSRSTMAISKIHFQIDKKKAVKNAFYSAPARAKKIKTNYVKNLLPVL